MTTPNIRLTIAYSTLAERMRNIVLPQARQDQEILILVQSLDGTFAPEVPSRSDVRVISLQGKGVAKSRNAAIDHAQGDYLVFADDDIVFDLTALDSITEHFASCQCDLVLGQAVDPEGQLRKPYPKGSVWLTRFNSARAATYEMVIRCAAIRQHGVRFDENFGAGALNYLGDEYIFITDMLTSGMKAHFLPITMATHPVESSGSGWGTPKDLAARAQIFTRVFGWRAFIVRMAFILRHRNKVNRFSDAFRFVLNRW